MLCPECAAPLRTKDTCAAAKPILALLDALVIACPACQSTMARSTYESHYADACSTPCPFASAGCSVSVARSQLNAHIDACPFVPVRCDAVEFGCPWTGQREQCATHHASCALHAALPVLERIQAEHAATLKDRNDEIQALRIALETREGQLKGYKDRLAGEDHWKVGTLIDALDTENSWLVARVQKVDPLARTYRIHYVDWDASWDESISWDSERLAVGGKHTGSEHVEKHVRKALAQSAAAAAQGTPGAATTPAAAAGGAGTPPARAQKRKNVTTVL